jgi:hypothetical protein
VVWFSPRPWQLPHLDSDRNWTGGISWSAVKRSRAGTYDPPRHERLPINDDEIIDRALAAQSTASSPVTLLTYDTSQAARARHAGLAVNKFTKPLGDETEDTRGKKKARQPVAGER